MVDGDTGAVELATEHLSGDGHAEHITGELDVGLQVINVGGTLENLRSNKHKVISKCTFRDIIIPRKIDSTKLRIVSYLHDGALAGNFQDLALAHLTVTESDIDDFGVSK